MHPNDSPTFQKVELFFGGFIVVLGQVGTLRIVGRVPA